MLRLRRNDRATDTDRDHRLLPAAVIPQVLMAIIITIAADLAITALAVMITAAARHLCEITTTGIDMVALPHVLAGRLWTITARHEAGMLTMGMTLVRCRPVEVMILIHI